MAKRDFYSMKEKEENRYSPSSAANRSRMVAAGTQNAPQNSARDKEQSAPRLQGDTCQKSKREKTPSERGEEAVRLMLEEEFPEMRQPAAVPTTPAAAPTTKTAVGNKKTVQYNNSSTVTAPYSGGTITSYGNITAAPYGSTGTLQNARQHEQAFSFQPSTYDSVAAQILANARPGENALRNMQWDNGFPSSLQSPGGTSGPLSPAPAWQPAAQYPAAVRFDESNPDGSQYGDSIYGLDEDGGSGDAVPEEPMITIQDIATMGTGNYTLPVAIWLRDQTKPLWEDTHIAEEMSVPLYWVDRGLIGAAVGLEGLWNGIVDLSSASVNADLERQRQQAQMYAVLGGPFQQYADDLTRTTQLMQEALPESAEILRSHKAAEYAQEIEIQDEALPKKERNDILNDKSDLKKHAQKEWWEVSGASETIDPDHPTYQAMNAVLTDDDRAGGLSVVKIDGEYYIDYTPVINTRLHEVEQDFQNHTIYDPRVIQARKILLSNIMWFISQVNEYGPWDIKEKDSWKMQFGNVRIPSPPGDPIAYNGQVVNAENLGNLTYGYLGRAMGWPAEILYLGGGVVNQIKSAWDSTKALVTDERDISACLNSWLNAITPFVYFNGSYGDGENDNIFIKQGVELYEAVH